MRRIDMALEATDEYPGIGPVNPGMPPLLPDDPEPGPAVAPTPPAAPAPGLRADDPWPEAGRKLLCFNLARVLARVPGVLVDEDPEEVHAMRVAARRMRAVWRVFGDGFDRETRRHYQGELRAIGAGLGGVRDLDVQIGILDAYRQRRSSRQRAGLDPLLAALRSERLARLASLVEVLGSDRFAAFADDYDSLTRTPGRAAVEVAAHTPGTVRHRMPARIWDAYQAVWAFDMDPAAADLAALHELRIAAKWLRYTLEFVREPLDPQATALIRPVVALQDELGTVHDWHLGAELARAFLASSAGSGKAAKPISRFIDTLDAGVDRRRAGLGRTWQPLVAPDYRRALGRAIARL